MTVEQLIKQLEAMDSEKEVYVHPPGKTPIHGVYEYDHGVEINI